MSSVSRWSYTNTATIWPATVDEYGQPSYGQPFLVSCTWADTGDSQTDDNGTEFVPASTFWLEAEYGSPTVPKRGDYIVKFDHTDVADPISISAQVIKKVTSWDMTMFGASEVPDWAVFT